jgi:methylated-DNA-[protein]-cysteine S-methyltransferase
MSPWPFHRLSLESPVGWLTLYASDAALIEISWAKSRHPLPSSLLREAARQLSAYFKGRLREFDLPLEAEGTEHERAVWREMRQIPYGETATYGALAAAIGSAPRAIGRACGANPIPIVIPCHRVTASGGALGGYSGAGGLATKKFLLALEARQSGLFAPRPAPIDDEKARLVRNTA